MNLLEQQASNRRRTLLIMAAFVLFLGFIGFGFDLFLLGIDRSSVPLGLVAALSIGSLSAVSSYYGGDKAVLASARAQELTALQAAPASDEERFRYRQLENVVDEMAIASGLPRPAVYVVPDPDPNAFATGRDPQHASIAVTRGLLYNLDRDELQAVVAHEMSHIRNYDIRLMTIVAALVGAVVLLADWARRGMRYGGARRGGARRGRKGGGGAAAVFVVVWLVAIVLAPLVARVMAMAVSRQREFLADASAAELTRNPMALANALEKIDSAAEPTRAMKEGSAHLCIADPLVRKMGLREGFFADLFASHPPMEKRIAALRRMAYQA
jgi:heat shock protein HtpX